MGSSSSKRWDKPTNPMQVLYLQEMQRARQKLQWEKEQKQIAKLQKKQAKKHKKKKKNDLKWKNGRSSVTKRKSSTGSQRKKVESFDKEEWNRQIESRTRNDLDNNLATFVLNQISLTMQFFGDYERDVAAIAQGFLAEENAYNQHLEDHSILLANPLDAAVAQWLHYNPIHGPDKDSREILQPLAMYVVFENIDVSRPSDANYDSISPLCKVDLDSDVSKSTPCREDFRDMLREIKWNGYVRLKLRETSKVQKVASASTNAVYAGGSSGQSTNSARSTKAASMSSGSSSGYCSEIDYDYAYITHLNTHHPLAELKLSNVPSNWQLDAKVLPETCVTCLKNVIDRSVEVDSDDETDHEDDEGDDSEGEAAKYPPSHSRSKQRYNYEAIRAVKLCKRAQERRKVLLQQQYLNSKEFMRYFGELLQQKLAQQLRIPQEELDAATYRGTSIYTSQFEIIPAVHVARNVQSWPDCAFQFKIRERPISIDPRTGRQFQWPTRSMIRRIETFGYHVIPVGYVPKRHRNPFRELEWRIVFPKAERYLQRQLSTTQVKVFMLTKALVKTFIEPLEENQSLIFALDCLRAHLFWECERNYAAWPEEFLGELLVDFIDSFLQRLREKVLRDYFIEKRNLFECIPEYSLATLYGILADIRSNPLMHLMVALKNLEFVQPDFPKLNFRQLYAVLVEDDMLKLQMQSKSTRHAIDHMDDDDDESLSTYDEEVSGFKCLQQERAKSSGRLRKRTHLMRHNIEMHRLQEEAKLGSMESIDLEFIFTGNLSNAQSKLINQGEENLRRTNILEILLDHLVVMAEKATNLQTLHEVNTYVAQAKRLCKLYYNLGCDVGAEEYLVAIDKIEDLCKKRPSTENSTSSAPELPVRTRIETIPAYRKNDPKMRSLPKRHFYVEVEPKIELSTGEAKDDTIIENVGNVSEEEGGRGHDTSPERLKSIKFIEHVVEVHDSNPIQKTQDHRPTSVLRERAQVHQSDLDEIVVEPRKSAVEPGSKCIATELTARSKSAKSENGIMQKLGSLAAPIMNSRVMEKLSSATASVMTSLSVEEKGVQLRAMFNKKAVQLMGSFDETSEL